MLYIFAFFIAKHSKASNPDRTTERGVVLYSNPLSSWYIYKAETDITGKSLNSNLNLRLVYFYQSSSKLLQANGQVLHKVIVGL